LPAEEVAVDGGSVFLSPGEEVLLLLFPEQANKKNS